MMKRHARVMNLAVSAVCSMLLGALILPGKTAYADSDRDRVCGSLPGQGELQAALATARQAGNGGFNLDMWGTVVNRDGIVCAVAFTGADRGSEWPGSRVISAQKANTANSFSLPGLALSTADLYAAVQPGGSLFGLQESNPVDTETAYRGPSAKYGTANDPLVGFKIGGINVFGGGLALYTAPRPHRRDRGQRRHVVRRPQHRLADPSQFEPGLPSSGTWSGNCRARRQHQLSGIGTGAKPAKRLFSSDLQDRRRGRRVSDQRGAAGHAIGLADSPPARGGRRAISKRRSRRYWARTPGCRRRRSRCKRSAQDSPARGSCP